MSPAPRSDLLHSPMLLAQVPDAAGCRARVGMLQAVLDGLFEAACIVDGASLAVLGMNQAAGDQLQRSADSLIGQAVTELVASPEDHHFWLSVQDTLRAGLSATDTRMQLHSDTLMVRADGELAQVERRIVPIELPSGHPAWLMSWQDHSATRQAETELDRMAAELGGALEGSRDAVLVTDLDGGVRGCNQAYLQLIGLPAGTPANTAALAEALLAQAQDRRACRQLWQALHTETRATRTERLALVDGRTLEWHSVAQYAQGRLIGRTHSLRDLTEQLANETRLRVAGEVFDTSREAILVLDQQLRVVAANRTAALITGQPLERLQGRPLADLLQGTGGASTLTDAIESLPATGRWDGELALRGLDDWVPVQVAIATVPANAEGHARTVVNLLDLRERQAQERVLHELSHTDALTRLPNRQRLAERTVAAIAQARQGTGGFAMLSVGIDRFSQINDSLGHDIGDSVLIAMAARLASCVRQHDMVARLGGDTFMVLLDEADATTAEVIAQRMLDALGGNLRLDAMDLSVRASVGAAFFPADGQTMDELVRNADIAMHHAKGTGGELRLYEPRMNSELLAKVRLDHAMREALRLRQFDLHYQAQVDLRTGALIGTEALLRWTDPVLGNVPPAHFIPVAEETGFIIELGDHVLERAIERAAAWHAQGKQLTMAVNVSALQFQQPHFVERVLSLLAEAGLPGHRLELELTEGVLAGNIGELVERLKVLASHGVSLAVDDFGTGYSSLSYLKRLPIHRLKIDRSFVQGLPTDPSDAAIVRSVIDMGRALHLHVVAEGVETAAQRDFLLAAGCDEAQGYFYAKPVPLAQFERSHGLLGQRPPRAAARRRRTA
ncbi:MAG: EAL domain-containing protein [Burkholderiales bacterium]